MIDNLINTEEVPLLLLCLLGFAVLIHLVWHWLFFWKLARHRFTADLEKVRPVSVVICAHNEYLNLKENLPLILEQDYPDFEVLVVNHASDDDTHYLLSYLSERYPRLKSIMVQEDLNFFTGKKFPLSIGIKSARNELILLTDADCRPAGKDWIRCMQSAFVSKSDIVLGYGPFIKKQGLINKLIRFDAAHNAAQYLSFALAGIPYMGVGRNLSYRKQLFFDNNGFIAHYRIHSGDDDLFINQVARKKNTAIMVEPASFMYSAAKETLGSWMLQKKKRLVTSSHYRFSHKILLRLYSFSYLAMLFLFIFMLSMNWSVIPVLGIFLLRLISQYAVLSGCFSKLREKDLLLFLIPLEFMMYFANSIAAISGKSRKHKRWK